MCVYSFVVLSCLFFATILMKPTVVICPDTPLANENLVQSANERSVWRDSGIWILQPLGHSWPVNFPAVYGFRMPNAVDWRSIHHHYTGLGKAHTSCETVHDFWARARVERDTFLSSIWLAIDTVYMTLHPIPLNFLIYEENFIFFFISVVWHGSLGCSVAQTVARRLGSRSKSRIGTPQRRPSTGRKPCETTRGYSMTVCLLDKCLKKNKKK